MSPRFLTSLAMIIAVGAPMLSHADTKIRIMASNITSGNNQSYQAPGTNILKAVKPDIALMNEFEVDSGTLASWVSSTFGPEYSFYVESGAGIPNGIVSRYPIKASGEYTDPDVSNRDFAWARIDIPGDKDLWAISVHFLTASSGARNSQATTLINNMLPSLNIPAGDYLVLGGDFNTDSRSESCLSTLRAKYTIASPYPVDQTNDGDTNASRAKPYDWVVVSPGLDALETAFTYGSFSSASGFVFDSRKFSQSDLNTYFSPVQVSDSGATNMQHMGVIRDFLVPDGGTTPGDDFTVTGNSVNFGTGLDIASAPFNNSSINLTVTSPFQITGVSITGANPTQFAVTSPAIPGTISASTPITFRWTPTANDGQTRTATANFTTNGSPASFSVALSGATKTTSGGPGGEGAVYFEEDFEATSLGGSYTVGTFTAGSGTWGANSVLLESASDSCVGVAARINDDTANAYMQTPALTQGAGTLRFSHRELNIGGGTITIQAATAAAGPYTQVGTLTFGGATCAQAAIPVQMTGTVYLRIVNNNQAGHLIIDELSVTSFTEVVSSPSPSAWMIQ